MKGQHTIEEARAFYEAIRAGIQKRKEKINKGARAVCNESCPYGSTGREVSRGTGSLVERRETARLISMMRRNENQDLDCTQGPLSLSL